MDSGYHMGQCRTRPWGVDSPVGLCQYNIINTGPEVSTACMGAQKRGKPNLRWGRVGQGSVSRTAPFTEFWRMSRNWPGKEGHLSEGAAYEKAWRCGSLQCISGIMRRKQERAARGWWHRGGQFMYPHSSVATGFLTWASVGAKVRWYIGPHRVSKSPFSPL